MGRPDRTAHAQHAVTKLTEYTPGAAEQGGTGPRIHLGTSVGPYQGHA